MGWGNSYPFVLEIMEGGLDYGKRKCDNYCRLGSARLGSARLDRSIAPFFQRVKSYFIQFITNRLPETGRIVPWLRLLRLPEGWWFDIEVLTATGKSIFSG